MLELIPDLKPKAANHPGEMASPLQVAHTDAFTLSLIPTRGVMVKFTHCSVFITVLSSLFCTVRYVLCSGCLKCPQKKAMQSTLDAERGEATQHTSARGETHSR